ncbi:hypothetical protein OOO30_004515 [Salmonella enterica]|uniref:hypothetical protein n=2 Tax=Enterobacterales TaxID=91347 RepID=UPI000574E92C|nr:MULTISPECIES: hypothetical protein [Enterobacter]EHA4513884.1 hypothetical protein [Escherichia coli]EHN8807711.1 hypothetical protein [Enterobacter roggenkampii]EKC2282130.1 hypothetical protein [Salmonella enterica]MBS0854414.1 hypothetical protein [Enterobacter sp. JGM127]OIR47513.1 hypothetical protein BH716_00465 [Lelliottia nimipressuralis]
MTQHIAWDTFPIQFNEKVKSEVTNVAAWLSDEYTSRNIISDDDLKYCVMRKLDKIALSAMPAPYLGRTLLLMAFYGLLEKPGVISFEDIEDARWLLDKEEYGVPASPCNPDKLHNFPKSWFKR